METQNVTLTIPKNILHRVKLLAVERRVSLSGLLTQTLAEMVALEDSYIRARQRHLTWLEHAANLGTEGTIHWRREELHER
ncbi:MAG: CopG family transcriptional regulator [Chloroflexi bacterium]|nr:CopG family transcriptional regulator [Chloroflexota bacterium]